MKRALPPLLVWRKRVAAGPPELKLVVMVALPAVALPRKPRLPLPPTPLVVMLAVPAELVLLKETSPPELLMIALPAVLLLLKFKTPMTGALMPLIVNVGANDELLTMPVPEMLSVWPATTWLIVKV